MGNRAVITHSTKPDAPVIYLHWNGGKASVLGFLQTAKRLNIVGTHKERMDKLAAIIAKFFFGTEVGLTVYRQTYDVADKDNYDNGVYVIDDDWQIVDRLYTRYPEQMDYDPKEIANEIIGDIVLTAMKAKEPLFVADENAA